MWLVRVALRRPYTFVIVSLLILISGIVSILTTPTEILPEINIPIVSGRDFRRSFRQAHGQSHSLASSPHVIRCAGQGNDRGKANRYRHVERCGALDLSGRSSFNFIEGAMTFDTTEQGWLLIYGLDALLLQTRGLLVSSAGYSSDAVSSCPESLRALMEVRVYRAIVLCLTTLPEDRAWIEDVVQRLRPGTRIYPMTGAVYPTTSLAELKGAVDNSVNCGVECSRPWMWVVRCFKRVALHLRTQFLNLTACESRGAFMSTKLLRMFATILFLASVTLAENICFGQQRASSDAAFGTGQTLPTEPVARSPLTLEAVTDKNDVKNSFRYKSREIPPVIRAYPGETVRIRYVNRMSPHSKELCVDGPCTDMSNLHFHGLHVSPDTPQDDSISMMAMPGQSLDYRVQIPLDQAPGLYWYHTHPHGESYQQSLDGLSGAIVIEGIGRYIPELRSMKERVLVLRDSVLKPHDPASLKEAALLQVSSQRCSAVTEAPERALTVNGALRPRIDIAPGERQFWRIVNASPDLYADLSIDSEQMTVVALDGMPLPFHDPNRRTQTYSHVLLPPAGRVEAIVAGPKAGARSSLRTSCVDTGKDGDTNPSMILADLDTSAPKPAAVPTSPRIRIPAVYKPLSHAELATFEASSPDFTVIFTEDSHGFYINGKKYSPTGGPMTTVLVGHYQHWRVLNNSDELHPFHIHQIHFLAYERNGKQITPPEWLDTINVPTQGSVDLVMDFTDPIIRGTSLFHCHLLKHEDKGMMAKILFR